MVNPTEDQVAAQAKRLYPHIRDHLHTDDELSILAKKLKPHSDDLDAQQVGKFVVGEALAVIRKALWALGAGALAFFSFKWFGK